MLALLAIIDRDRGYLDDVPPENLWHTAEFGPAPLERHFDLERELDRLSLDVILTAPPVETTDDEILKPRLKPHRQKATGNRRVVRRTKSTPAARPRPIKLTPTIINDLRSALTKNTWANEEKSTGDEYSDERNEQPADEPVDAYAEYDDEHLALGKCSARYQFADMSIDSARRNDPCPLETGWKATTKSPDQWARHYR